METRWLKGMVINGINKAYNCEITGVLCEFYFLVNPEAPFLSAYHSLDHSNLITVQKPRNALDRVVKAMKF